MSYTPKYYGSLNILWHEQFNLFRVKLNFKTMSFRTVVSKSGISLIFEKFSEKDFFFYKESKMGHLKKVKGILSIVMGHF